MAHSQMTTDRPELARVGSLVAASTLALTLALFGVVAFAAGATAGLSTRVPYYVLAAAVTFAAVLVGLDRHDGDGRSLLVGSLGAAVVAFCLVTLGFEGVAYAIRRPDAALGHRRVLTLLAAALYSTGLGYWALSHWRGLARDLARLAPAGRSAAVATAREATRRRP